MTAKSIPTAELPNIGKILSQELEKVGIKTLGDLEEVGSAEALFMIKGVSGRSCLNKLYALQGAIQGIRWHSLSKEEKEQIKSDFLLLTKEQRDFEVFRGFEIFKRLVRIFFNPNQASYYGMLQGLCGIW